MPSIPILLPVKADTSAMPEALSTAATPRFYRNHLLLPLMGAICLSTILMGLQGDFLLADRLYALQGHAWTVKSLWSPRW